MGLLLGQYLKEMSNVLQGTFAFLMTCLNCLLNQGRLFYIMRELFIIKLLVSLSL